MKEEVILVNEQDQVQGSMEKMEAHKKGVLHRAFSVFIFNSQGEMLIQQRAFHKYHSAGLWTNACCSHPRPGETTEAAAHRRLKEEIGITLEIKHHHEFVYKVKFNNGLTEHEYDHVFVGNSDDSPEPNTEEVAAFKWITLDALKSDLISQPEHYTYWFKLATESLFLK